MRKRRRYNPSARPRRRRPPNKPRVPTSTKFRGARGLPWFAPEQWEQLLEVSADRALLGEDYGKWLAQAEQAFEGLKGCGITIKKVLVDVDELTDWCRQNRLPVDADSRPAYVADLLRTGRAAVVE